MNSPIDRKIQKILGFKKIHQLGFVVKDMDQAMTNFSSTLGVRKWYRANSGGEDSDTVTYKGKTINSKLDFVMGYCGKTQIELITTSGDENIYSVFLREKGEGLHHICFFVPDIQRKLQAFAGLGMEPVQTGIVRSKGGAITHYAYLESTDTKGLVIELSETRLYGINTKMSPFMMKVGHATGDLSLA